MKRNDGANQKTLRHTIQQTHRAWRTALPLMLLLSLSVSGLAQHRAVDPVQGQSSPGDSVQKINVGGVERTFIRHLPQGYDGSTPVPLVVVLHGRGGNAKEMEQLTGFSHKADAEKFIVVYPNGIGTPTGWGSGIDPTRTTDDVGFIRAMIDRLEHNHKIDPKRIYVCGFSAGAMMTYRLGGELAQRFAAIGVASGTVGAHQSNGTTYTVPSPARPVPAIVFHGKQDTHVPYNGGAASSGFDPLSVADSIAFWTKADGCNSTPQEKTEQNGNLVVDDYNQCRDGSEVTLYTFANGTHEWPKLSNNDHFDATDAIWQFFVKHPKP